MNNNGNVIGWGTLMLINAGLAQGKGRSGLAWWWLSLLLGPIATFFLVLQPTLWPEPEEPSQALPAQLNDRSS